MRKNLDKLIAKMSVANASFQFYDTGWITVYTYDSINFGYINLITGYVSPAIYELTIVGNEICILAFKSEHDQSLLFTATTKYNDKEIFSRENISESLVKFIKSKIVYTINKKKCLIEMHNIYGKKLILKCSEITHLNTISDNENDIKIKIIAVLKGEKHSKMIILDQELNILSAEILN